MSESKGRRYDYEAMFLVSPAAGQELAGVAQHITDLLTKSGAEVIALKKWDERRLAYEIDKNKRGVYLLGYFSVDPVGLDGITRDCNLSETILRSLVTRADHLTRDEMLAADAREDIAVESALREEAPAAS